MSPVVDGSVIEEFTAIEKGTWNAILSDVEYNDEKEYYKCEFTITEEPYANQKAWRNLSVKDKALVFYKQAGVALGADPAIFRGKFDTDDVLPKMIGHECRIQTDDPDDTYDGTPRTVVKKILAPSGPRA